MLALLLLLAAPRPEFAAVEDDPALPRVLLIGDSISIGYTLPVREQLAGEANVHRPPVNCGPTTRGLERLEDWLSQSGTTDPTSWDVIHWNFGLHDLKFVDENNRPSTPGEGRHQVSLEDYRRNLDAMAAKLTATGAIVIWRNTTPVPEPGTAMRIPSDVVEYNRVAAEVMAKHDIAIHDLYSFAKANESEIQRPANVHYTPEGSAQLAEEVAKVIREAIAQRAAARSATPVER